MKNLPLVQQTLKDIIESDCLYVDKTEEIYKLVEGKSTFFYYVHVGLENPCL